MPSFASIYVGDGLIRASSCIGWQSTTCLRLATRSWHLSQIGDYCINVVLVEILGDVARLIHLTIDSSLTCYYCSPCVDPHASLPRRSFNLVTDLE